MGFIFWTGFKYCANSLGLRFEATEREAKLKKNVDAFFEDIIKTSGEDPRDYEVVNAPSGLFIRHKKHKTHLDIRSFFYKVPPDFPRLTVYGGSVFTGSMIMGNKKMVGFESEANSKDIRNYYQDRLKKTGWMPMSSPTVDNAPLIFVKEGGQLTIHFTPLKEPKTSIVFSFEQEEDRWMRCSSQKNSPGKTDL